jgi:hypothetical protein
LSDVEKQEQTALEKIEAKRAARKAALKQAEETQKAKDLEAVFNLECQLGDSNVGVMHVPYVEGLPTLIAVRAPRPVELKRFRQTVAPKDPKQAVDAADAAEALAHVCREYPEPEVYQSMLAARPGLGAQLGALAIKLGTGVEEREGKG